MSEKNLIRFIKRLRLKAGDVLVVRDPSTAEALMNAGQYIKLKLDIPIIIAPEGVEKVSLKQLKKVVGRIVTKSIPAYVMDEPCHGRVPYWKKEEKS